MKPYYEDEKAGISIFHGDCREVLPALPVAYCWRCHVDLADESILAIHIASCRDVAPRFDLLATDPPYGLGAARRNFGGNGVKRHMTGLLAGKCVKKRDYGDSSWDDEPADQPIIQKAISLSMWQIIWGGNYFDLPKARCWLLWDKLRGDTDYADGEMAWTNLDKAVRIIRWRWNGFLQENQDDREEPIPCPRKAEQACARLAGNVLASAAAEAGQENPVLAWTGILCRQNLVGKFKRLAQGRGRNHERGKEGCKASIEVSV